MNNFRSKRIDSDSVKPTRYFSSKQEHCIAEAVGGVLTPNSGATAFSKGDILTDKWSIEAKTCTKVQKSFSIKSEWFEKQKQDSLFMGKPYSAIVFNFGPDTENYYIIDEITFKELLEYQNNE